ncbi:DUF4132 domain-containing protein [Nocardia sp. CC227C]|uniref:DUF4132 domain-containing protein n=1 Tax=Nocardia sp. CC227C TaxID=3044562 RepID=UPI00278C4996|nr:DUF4132 domain-containing protein [Nocardia sp. CC227C]
MADESGFEPTAKQLKQLLFRRDGVLTAPACSVDVEAAAERAGDCLRYIGSAVERLEERAGVAADEVPESVGELGVELAAALLGTRAATPYYLTPGERRRALADAAALLDYWGTVRGWGFAAEVLLRAVTEPLWVRPSHWDSRGEAREMRAVLGALRNRLAGCSTAELAPALAVLERYRGTSRWARVVTSVLLPSRREWVAADIEDAVAAESKGDARLLVDAAGSVAQLRRLNSLFTGYWYDTEGLAFDTPGMAITVVDGVGFDAVAMLTHWFDHPDTTQALRTPIADALGVIPTDAAFAALAARTFRPPALTAVREAAARFPMRALRLLDPGTHGDILREHIHGHPELARRLRAELPTATAELIAIEMDRMTSRPATDVADIPRILRNPPWQHRQRGKGGRAGTVPGLAAPTDPYCAWLPGEREEWRSLVRPDDYADLDKTLERRTDGSLTEQVLGALVLAGPERALPILATSRLRWLYGPSPQVKAAIAEFETAAYPMVVAAAREYPRDMEDAIVPYAGTELIDLAIARLDRRTLRPGALRYLRRHARHVAHVLIPRAVGSAAKDRRLATRVLRLLAAHGHDGDIHSAAAEYGDKAAAAVTALLAADPLTLLPARLPTVPAWVNTAALPRVLTADGAPLPAAAVDNLLVMLMLADPFEPYAGVAQVSRDCDPASLAELAWELFSQWQRAGAPTRHSWVYDALGSFGDDETVAALLDHVRTHRSDLRSVSALDAFVAIGSDAALLALRQISEKVKTTRVREGAKERIEAVAERLGLTADQLADRLVPDLGLRADGTAVLDFGPRRFVVGFDDQLRPTVATADGTPLRSLPKPGARDDVERAAQAHKDFRALKKNARAVAADQIRRLERAMVTGRRFTVAELRTLFIDHPLRWHVTRRLVWGVYDGDTPASTFRIAEDRGFADSSDDLFTLADDAVLGVAHPLGFPDEVAAWRDIFADYELLQPFPQIERETFALPDELRDRDALGDAGVRVQGPRLLGLASRGWLSPETGGGGYIDNFEKPLPHGRVLYLSCDPGLPTWDLNGSPEQSFEARLHPTRSTSGGITFADLDPVTVSEILRDIAWLRHGRE